MDQIRPEAVNETRTKKILIVEDEPLNLEIARTFIIKDYLVETASSGEEALEKIKSGFYHLILMDINLGPGLSGLDLIALMKQDHPALPVPVIALTAYALKHNVDNFLAKGFVHVITKPFTKKLLLYTIDKYIL